MTSKVMHCILAYYFLKCVSACFGAQVLIRSLLLLLEKPAFDWSCLRSEITLHRQKKMSLLSSGRHLLSATAFATAWK